jgi:hypothetical protein
MRDQQVADPEGWEEDMIRTGTKSATARCCARYLAVAASLASVVALAVLPRSAASAAVHHWSAPVIIDTNSADAVSCPSTTFCMALGNQSDAISWDGSAWSAPVTIDPDGILLSVSCASSRFCVAADNQGYFLTWNGTSWSAPVLVDHDTTPGPAVYSISCTSPRFCMAVDNIGQALVFNGATWFLDTSAIFPGSNALAAQVSCKSAIFCMAVRGGYAVSWDGRAFSAPVNVVAPVYDFTSVSCPAQGSCVAVSNNAVGYYNGGQWTATEGVNHGSYISCPTAGLCISVGLPADAWTYRSGAWSGPVVPGSRTFGPAGLSCPAWNFCMAVGDNQSDGVAASYS